MHGPTKYKIQQKLRVRGGSTFCLSLTLASQYKTLVLNIGQNVPMIRLVINTKIYQKSFGEV